MGEPKYDEDVVNLGYLRKQLKDKADKNDIPTATSKLINDSNFVNATQMNTAINKIDTLNVHGTVIHENDDLNNYTTAGVFYASTGTISASLSNTPVTNSGFKLIVEYLHSTERIRQTIETNNASTSAMYVRTYTGSWGRWFKFDMTAV